MNGKRTILRMMTIAFAAVVAMMLTEPAFGYVGPAGIGLIGVLIAVVLVVLVGVAGLVLYPMRMMMRKKKLREQENGETDAQENT